MKILSLILYAIGICFCIARFMGHSEALPSALLCLVAANMITLKQRKNKHNTK